MLWVLLLLPNTNPYRLVSAHNVCVSSCVCICVFVCVFVYVCTCVCVYVCVSVLLRVLMLLPTRIRSD